MLRAINLTKKYGEFLAVNGISFEVGKGEVLGVIGENGAGKSTTLKMLVGLLTPTSGEIHYDGRNLFENLNAIKRKIGYLPEFDALYDNLNAKEYLRVFAEIYGVDADMAEKRIYELLETLNLPDDKPVGEFSKGMKRKLSIARTLVHDPEYLIYDEPTSGLDPSTSLFVTEYVRDLGKQGKTVVFSAHNMFYVESACDLLLIIKKGRVLYFGELDALRDRMKKYMVSYRIGEREFEDVFEDVRDVNRLLAEITENGGEIISIETRVPRLEEIYFTLTDGKSIMD
ncbi:ABC transporter ATP-binding protein [Geoglobus acetivorans]|uniref:Oligopeptide transport ATP-binding protein OppF n=1 Tax=Geoglobus acetivorans TaxID=565033 RepID=A0A0A7GE38_GEOAI|nr:Oligopeptide transport ATP-binding protein OppF [Geoglobus acetivorans]